MDFYERLTALMKDRGLSQKDLETELNFSNGSVSKWMKSKPNADRMQKLAKYFGVSVEYLKDGVTDEYEMYTPELASLVGQIRNDKDLSNALLKYFNLSEEKKKHVVELINLL